MQKEGRFSDLFGGMEDTFSFKLGSEPGHVANGNSLHDDPFELVYLLGLPEVIVRNMKTAMKIISLISKKIGGLHEDHENYTENLIYTLKLEIDSEYDHNGDPFTYLLSKLYIVKFSNIKAHPQPASSTAGNQSQGLNPKGGQTAAQFHKSNNSQWYITLMNLLQEELLSCSNSNDDEGIPKGLMLPQDQFINFIAKTVLLNHKHLSQLYVFNIIDNKLTPNECLNSLKLVQYL